MRGKWELTNPADVLCNINVEAITIGECQDLYDQLSGLGEPPASDVARIVRAVIMRANGEYTVGLQYTPPLPPVFEAEFNGAEIIVSEVYSDGATSYRLCGGFSTPVEKGDNERDLDIDTTVSVSQGKTYYLAAYATGPGGASELSDEVVVEVPFVGVPSLSGVRDGEVNTITIEAVDYATSYIVYRDTTSGVSEDDEVVYEGSDLTFTDTVTGAAYYRAKAVTPFGDGGLSVEYPIS